MDTYHPSQKIAKVGEPDMRDTAGESRSDLKTDVLRRTPSQGRAKTGRPVRTYIHQLCADTESSPEDLPESMDDREGQGGKFMDIPANGAIW